MSYLIQLIHIIARILIFIVIVQAILSFFMSPFHPIRRTLDRIVDPLLSPIRRIVPPLGNIDFSPLVLVILVQVLDSLLTYLLSSIG
jgi:YggT family protein